MKLFQTDNNLTMLECKPYNWLVDYMYRIDLTLTPKDRLYRSQRENNPLTFTINIGSYGETKFFRYNPLEQLLVVGDLSIDMKTFQDASNFVEKCVVGCEKDEERKDRFRPEGRNIYICKPTKGRSVDNKMKIDFNLTYQKYNKLLRKQKLERINK